MNYENFRPTLWNEFKTPAIVVVGAVLILTGLNNTFYTSVYVDSKKVNVAWKENVVSKNALSQQVIAASQYNEVTVAQNVSYEKYLPSNNEEVVVEQPAESNPETHSPKNEYVVIDGDLSVSATEFYHPQLATALGAADVTGQLEVQNGEVKGLSVQINSDKAQKVGISMISTGESEIQGNIFTYEIDGQNYTATIYPTNPNEYMVSFVNGPWNGARVKFTTPKSDNEYQAPEVGVTNREWASSESELESNQLLDDNQQEVSVSSSGDMVQQESNENFNDE